MKQKHQAHHSTDGVHKQNRLGSIWHKTHKHTSNKKTKSIMHKHRSSQVQRCRGALKSAIEGAEWCMGGGQEGPAALEHYTANLRPAMLLPACTCPPATPPPPPSSTSPPPPSPIFLFRTILRSWLPPLPLSPQLPLSRRRLLFVDYPVSDGAALICLAS